MSEPQLGDYGVTKTGGWGARLIRFGTRSSVNHAFLYVGHGTIIEAEPGKKGAQFAAYDKYPDAIWSNIPLTDLQRVTIAVQGMQKQGVRYNWLDIAAITLDILGIRFAIVNKRISKMNMLICSQLVDLSYEEADVHLFTDGRLPGEVTPADLLIRIEQEKARA